MSDNEDASGGNKAKKRICNNPLMIGGTIADVLLIGGGIVAAVVITSCGS